MTLYFLFSLGCYNFVRKPQPLQEKRCLWPLQPQPPEGPLYPVKLSIWHRAVHRAESELLYQPPESADQVIEVHKHRGWQENILEGPDLCGSPGQGTGAITEIAVDPNSGEDGSASYYTKGKFYLPMFPRDMSCLLSTKRSN